MNLKKANIKKRLCLIAVSYTHLDVYKRQVLQEEILKENTPNLMADITGNMLKEKEADILTILADLPDAQTMIGWMKKVHGLTTMQELTLDEALKTTTQRLSPYIRQRLTFMRLLKFYDFYDEITEG